MLNAKKRVCFRKRGGSETAGLLGGITCKKLTCKKAVEYSGRLATPALGLTTIRKVILGCHVLGHNCHKMYYSLGY